MRVGAPGAERPVVLLPDGRHLDLSGLTDDIDGEFLAGDGPGRLRDAVAEGRLPEIDVAGQRVGSPIARPGVVLCVGMNYAAHAAESGSAAPRWPVIFYELEIDGLGRQRQRVGQA
jgi:2-keto-4-pentenoate hydratase/2-oxohepta-3-ene-1,7-dioic acid hydratase in catechol pathway